ncbi:MAG: transketolase C-terminal domain-containing protein [Candidatus Altiarchaeota archaeon]
MRPTFANTLYDLAKRDKGVYLLTSDVGYSVFERFIDDLPKQYVNVGIAEANMIGISAGLASSGKKVFAYSMSHFLTLRCYEQIKLDLCYPKLNVKLIGSGGGLTYGSQGPTHQSNEDISIMRSLPNMCVICPGDPIETGYAVREALKRGGPVYIRLSKKDPIVHASDDIDFRIGKGIILNNGSDLTLISTGNMLATAKEVCERFQADGKKVCLVSMHTIKPLDIRLVKELAETGRPMFSLEEHSLVGGLGGAISEVLAELDCKVPFRRIALPDGFCNVIGSQTHLRRSYGLDPDSVYRTIRDIL